MVVESDYIVLLPACSSYTMSYTHGYRSVVFSKPNLPGDQSSLVSQKPDTVGAIHW